MLSLLQGCGTDQAEKSGDKKISLDSKIYPISVQNDVLKAFEVKSAKELTYSKFKETLKDFETTQRTAGPVNFVWCGEENGGSTATFTGEIQVARFIYGQPASIKFRFSKANDGLECLEIFQPKG